MYIKNCLYSTVFRITRNLKHQIWSINYQLINLNCSHISRRDIKMKNIIRRFARKIGFDIIRTNAVSKMGVNPYLDMAKFVDSKEPILFDVGANQGQTIFKYLEVFSNSNIYSFEPSPKAFEILRDNTRNIENVSIWNYGVGSKTDSLLLNENEYSVMSSFLELGDQGWGEIKKKTIVDLIALDDFLDQHNISKVDVLKLDTQGFELEIFKGLKKSMSEGKIGLLFFEVTFINMYVGLPSFTELYEFCIDNGFELVSIYPIHYRQSIAGWTDVLFKHKSYGR